MEYPPQVGLLMATGPVEELTASAVTAVPMEELTASAAMEEPRASAVMEAPTEAAYLELTAPRVAVPFPLESRCVATSRSQAPVFATLTAHRRGIAVLITPNFVES